ncbi:MAG: hypothetical protein A3F18_06750 [Legionellales bacterium RIFCSPHIGHO2_12_FULL_37_14]|nr:MAG: hypothetical protein A3F18_06750 [Legionellales bacterium RIFCSPHIGHO2_12_FULL_37_14]
MYLVKIILLSFLCVGISLAKPPEMKEVKQKLDDTVITTKINASLAKNGAMNPFKLHVSTKEGVVRLAGTVKDKKMFVEVLKLVRATKGVRKVNINSLKIQEVNMPITDAYITAKVETAVLKAKVFDDESIPLVGINAHTVNGKVVLSGFVKQNKSIPIIVKRVAKIHGVKKVESQLKVLAQGK